MQLKQLAIIGLALVNPSTAQSSGSTSIASTSANAGNKTTTSNTVARSSSTTAISTTTATDLGTVTQAAPNPNASGATDIPIGPGDSYVTSSAETLAFSAWALVGLLLV